MLVDVYEKIFKVPSNGPIDSVSSGMYRDDLKTLKEKWI